MANDGWLLSFLSVCVCVDKKKSETPKREKKGRIA